MSRKSSQPTLPILDSDRGKRTDELDLDLTFDPARRVYHRRGRQ